MWMKRILMLLFLVFIGILGWLNINKKSSLEVVVEKGGMEEPHPLSVKQMGLQEYPGSEITIEQNLPDGNNYYRFLSSYKSDGLKIFALLTIPKTEKPEKGFPAIVFNHGYIPPAEYRTTERYVAYTDAFSRNGYVVFKPDYRGHGNSEGNPEGAYYSPAYTVDVLNAVASIKKYRDVDMSKLGMWGHSMGGNITLRSMVVNDDIKAGVIWAGVVGSYEDMANNWSRSKHWQPSQKEQNINRPSRQKLEEIYGEVRNDNYFWNSIAPINFVSDISGPIQIHHGTADAEVPVLFSQRLDEALKSAGKEVELYIYEGEDHNLSKNLSTALNRSVAFFDKYLKE
jgi:dipeptidyl aminopeptidase/acylaminoacyl peptidase